MRIQSLFLAVAVIVSGPNPRGEVVDGHRLQSRIEGRFKPAPGRARSGPRTAGKSHLHLGVSAPFGRREFPLARDNLLKVAECQILHDPLAEVMADVGCEAAVNPSRYEDQAAVRPLLDTLRTCESYEECRSCLVTSNETQRRVGDIAANAQTALQATKDRFVRALAGDCRRLIDSYIRAGAMQLGGEAFCREALRLASGLVADARAVGCTVTIVASLLSRRSGDPCPRSGGLVRQQLSNWRSDLNPVIHPLSQLGRVTPI